MVFAPLTTYDTFSRTLPTTLGSTDDGQTWFTTASSVSVGSGHALIRAPINSSRSYSYISLVPSDTDGEVLFRFYFDSTAAWPLTDFGPMLNYKSGPTAYLLNIQGNYSEMAVQVLINGVRSEIARKSVSLSKNTHYWVRFKRDGTGLFAKLWADGVVEPASWTISTSTWNGAGAPTSGNPGIYVGGTRDAYDVYLENFYYAREGQTYNTNYATDIFASRTTTDGWGGDGTANEVWEGAFSDSPEYIGLNRVGEVSSSFGRATLTTTNGYYGSLGNSRGDDIEVTTTVRFIDNPSGVGTYLAGIRGTKHSLSNRLHMTGYAARLDTDSNAIKIVKRTSPSASWTTIATGTAYETPNNVDLYRVEIQIIGTTIRAKFYRIGDSAPDWQASVVDAAIASGSVWCGMFQSAAVTRNMEIDNFISRAPTQDVGATRNFVTTGVVGYPAGSDTTIAMIVSWDDDDNDTNTISVRYKPINDSTWSTFGGSITKNTGTETHTFTLTGLLPATTYMIEITYADVDGVQGPNPIIVTRQTDATGVLGTGLSVTDVDTDSISVVATYDRDSDNDSTALLESRITSFNENFIEDFFVDETEGEFLQNTTSHEGGSWDKHPTMTPEVNAILSGRYFYAATTNATDKLLYIHSVPSPDPEYHVSAALLGSQLIGNTGIAVRMNDTTETYYGFGIDSANSRWEYFKMNAGVKTVLQTFTFSGDLNLVYELEVAVLASQRSLYVNGVLVGTDYDNTLPETNRVGYYSTNIQSGTPSNQFRLSWFSATYRTTVGSWVSHGAMTANRTLKTFSGTASGLTQDTVYELRVTFSDPDGVTTSTFAVTAMTTGSAIELESMGATTSATSAIIDVFYNYDLNDNSFLTLQYKSTFDYLWTTIAFEKIRADRTIKKFSTTLSGLQPTTTYEVRVDVTDPDGVIEDSPTFLSGLFTTTGFSFEDKTQTLHYLWKVYDPDGVYLSTIPDAPDPEFSIYENGGVTDLTFEITRKMSEMQSNKIIAFQNTIDIWALDPSSSGMGPNLISDPDCDPAVGAWTLAANSAYEADGGPDDTSCLLVTATETQYETMSNPVEITSGLPLVISCVAKASGAKLRMYARSYNSADVAIDSSSEITETVGTSWQTLRIEYTPPTDTAYIRVIIRNTGRGQMRADKFTVLAKEMLIYRGRIESFTPKIDENGESISVDVLGLASLLSDDYIEFLQFVESQPQDDILAGRINYGAKDPADMMKKIIDEARRVNPMFTLYYTNESIRYTGNLMQYTFKDQQIRASMDKVRDLCPSGWHYSIEPDGLVILRGAEHAPTHVLSIGKEILRFDVEKSIRNLKNYIRVKGRQDEDMSEADGYGSINYIAFDQKSIDKYGKRTLFIRDAQLVDPESAKIVGDGRLDEANREEQRATCFVPDEKLHFTINGALRGYNTQAFRAGDNVLIIDPITGPRNTYWDQFDWDEGSWDVANVFKPLEEPVPIKTVRVFGDHVTLELSERPPSSIGDFSKFYRWMANKDRED